MIPYHYHPQILAIHHGKPANYQPTAVINNFLFKCVLSWDILMEIVTEKLLVPLI